MVDFCSCVFVIFGSSLNCNVYITLMCSLLYFRLGGITKNLITGPEGNSKFCFPETLDVPRGGAEGNIKGLGETKLTVALGASHKVLNIPRPRTESAKCSLHYRGSVL